MIGLGLSLVQPERRVLVLTGDGEALMGLGRWPPLWRRGPESRDRRARQRPLRRDGALQQQRFRAAFGLVPG
ncbi:MAG: hypothetical protein ACREFP_10670 [Acetobacteraceae bacterium]